jgi:hypothetical protein
MSSLRYDKPLSRARGANVSVRCSRSCSVGGGRSQYHTARIGCPPQLSCVAETSPCSAPFRRGSDFEPIPSPSGPPRRLPVSAQRFAAQPRALWLAVPTRMFLIGRDRASRRIGIGPASARQLQPLC